MDGPKFVIDYKNDTKEPVDELELLSDSSLTLDGKVYDRSTVAHTGSATLQPGETNTYTITLGSYMPREKFERKEYSEKLEQWRWKPLLSPGRHTIRVDFGGVQYSPVKFIWRGDVPYLYE